jgi:hypothetical protein
VTRNFCKDWIEPLALCVIPLVIFLELLAGDVQIISLFSSRAELVGSVLSLNLW